MALAFRLYGNYAWPPAVDPLQATGVEAGLLEVHMVADAGRVRAALVWRPGKVLPGSDVIAPVPSPIAGDHAIDHVIGLEGKEWDLWVDEAAGKGGLLFRGISLIEQFLDDKLDLRLPLANDLQYREEQDPRHSWLRVHAVDGAPVFSLSLHLPIPVAVSRFSTIRAFPLTARYFASPAAGKAVAPRIAKIFARSTGVAEADGGSLSELGQQKILPGDFMLGHFGLSERGDKNASYAKNFVIYSQIIGALGAYWPRNNRCAIEDLLAPYGFQAPRVGRFNYSKNEPSDLSLRFVRQRDGVVSGLIYRARVRPVADTTAPDGSDLDL